MLDRILLTDFRNHRETAIERTVRFNLLVGENGEVDVIRRAERVDDIKGPEQLPERFVEKRHVRVVG